MAADKGSDFIKRNRPPRVQIAYENPHDSRQLVELPFVMGVMSDLSGNDSPVEKPKIEERTFEKVTNDTLDQFVASVTPGVTMLVDNKLDDREGKLGVSLTFTSMEDFEPAKIAEKVPELARLLKARKHIANLQRYLSSKPQAQAQVKDLLDKPNLMAALADLAEKEAADSANGKAE